MREEMKQNVTPDDAANHVRIELTAGSARCNRWRKRQIKKHKPLFERQKLRIKAKMHLDGYAPWRRCSRGRAAESSSSGGLRTEKQLEKLRKRRMIEKYDPEEFFLMAC